MYQHACNHNIYSRIKFLQVHIRDVGKFIVMAAVTPLRKDFLYFANRRFLVHINRDGSGVRSFRLTNTSNAVAVDFDIRYRVYFPACDYSACMVTLTD